MHHGAQTGTDMCVLRIMELLQFFCYRRVRYPGLFRCNTLHDAKALREYATKESSPARPRRSTMTVNASCDVSLRDAD